MGFPFLRPEISTDIISLPFCLRYSVTSAFERDASDAVLDLTMDDDTRHKLKAQAKHWDPKKKKYVGQSNVSHLHVSQGSV